MVLTYLEYVHDLWVFMASSTVPPSLYETPYFILSYPGNVVNHLQNTRILTCILQNHGLIYLYILPQDRYTLKNIAQTIKIYIISFLYHLGI